MYLEDFFDQEFLPSFAFFCSTKSSLVYYASLQSVIYKSCMVDLCIWNINSKNRIQYAYLRHALPIDQCSSNTKVESLIISGRSGYSWQFYLRCQKQCKLYLLLLKSVSNVCHLHTFYVWCCAIDSHGATYLEFVQWVEFNVHCFTSLQKFIRLRHYNHSKYSRADNSSYFTRFWIVLEAYIRFCSFQTAIMIPYNFDIDSIASPQLLQIEYVDGNMPYIISFENRYGWKYNASVSNGENNFGYLLFKWVQLRPFPSHNHYISFEIS